MRTETVLSTAFPLYCAHSLTPPGFSTPHQALESCVGLTQTSEVEAGLEEEVRRAGGAPFATKEKQTSCLELPKWELGLRTLLVTTAATS